MKRFFAALALLLAATASGECKNYTISTPNSTLVMTADAGKPLYFRYYGARASLDEVFLSYRSMKVEAFRAFGTHCDLTHACLIKHADGDNATNLVVESVEQTSDATLSRLTFTLRDTAHPFAVRLHYDAYKDCDVMKFYAEYINNGKKSVSLQKYMSAALPVKSKDCVLLHLDGDHGNECNETIEPLTYGIKVLSTQDGSRPSVHNQAAFMLGTDGALCETSGNVIAGTLAWTGNFHIEFDNSSLSGQPTTIYAGINPVGADYTLAAKQTLATPEMIFAYSTTGKGAATRALHYWARHHQILDGTVEREVLLNSWEGVHMDVTQEGMNSMMTDFARLGGEMFVMDDGWFGDKYPRDTDKTSLGDWCVAKGKLPEGIDGLIRIAKHNNLKFGIWIEPEMVNTKSELYEKHPDWVLRHEAFEPTYGRGKTQLLLDLTNPKVQDFVVGVVDNLMTANPDIAYIKWDHNMSMLNASSPYLPKALQSNLYVDYHRSLRSILERIRAKYPTLIIQLCSAGGYRLNYGYMPYFQEVWGSDQTDARHRIFIQWGALDFYPANIIAAHVCSTQNKYTQRRVPVKFRFDVASMCRLGMEMVPSQLTEAEQAYAKRAIAEYKRLRPVIQQGDLYKLVSPYEGDGEYASLMYVNDKRDHAVAMFYRMTFTRHMPDKIIKLQGLDPDREYLIREVAPEVEGKPIRISGKRASGRFLMEEGIVIRELAEGRTSREPFNDVRDMNDYRSYMIELIAQ